MGRLFQRIVPGTVIAIIAIVIATIVDAGTNLQLTWHELALIALGVCAIGTASLAISPAAFRPITSIGFDVADVYIRTGEIERRTAHLERNAGDRRHRFLWNLLPILIASAIIAAVTAVA